MGPFERHDHVLLYIPNIIGYCRVILCITAFLISQTYPRTMMILYFAGFVMDELDGRAARSFNQASKFGAVLDMVTDRCATAGLLFINAVLNPKFANSFLFLLILDITSHWMVTQAALYADHKSHKDYESSGITKLYYSSRLLMGLCCVSCEVLYMCLYSFHAPSLHYPLPASLRHFPLVSWCVKLIGMFLGKGGGGVGGVAGWGHLLTVLSLPGFVLKQLINTEQLVSSVNLLVSVDGVKTD